nr:hypothetical protein Itr_chr15CG16470 [Ipomoea trifida]
MHAIVRRQGRCKYTPVKCSSRPTTGVVSNAFSGSRLAFKSIRALSSTFPHTDGAQQRAVNNRARYKGKEEIPISSLSINNGGK